MNLLYKAIQWWPNAYHVFNTKDVRIGIVNKRTVRTNGAIEGEFWFAHTRGFVTVPGRFATRTKAAQALPQEGKVQHGIEVLSGSV